MITSAKALRQNENKIIIYNYKNVQVPIDVLDVPISIDGKRSTIGDFFNLIVDENNNIKQAVNSLVNELEKAKKKTATAIELLQKEINKKGTI